MSLTPIDHAQDRAAGSGVDDAVGQLNRPVRALPFGPFSRDSRGPRIRVAIVGVVCDVAGTAYTGCVADKRREAIGSSCPDTALSVSPFRAKTFQSVISPWFVTVKTLAPLKAAQPARPEVKPVPLPYLRDRAHQTSDAFAVRLGAHTLTLRMRQDGMSSYSLNEAPASSLFWTVEQIPTHRGSFSCNLKPGDRLGTATLSGPTIHSYESLLEISQGCAAPFSRQTAERRTYAEDSDAIPLGATAHAEGLVPIGFGDGRAVAFPAP